MKALVPHQLYYAHLGLQERVNSEIKQDFVQALDEEKKAEAMIYLHVPFCEYICGFCPFDRSTDKSSDDDYVAQVKKEIDFYAGKKFIEGLEFTGIHFGGGTPTSLSSEKLGELIDYVRRELNVYDVPLHVESSATTLPDGTIGMFKDKCVTRTSFGVQSFNPTLRKKVGIGASLDDVLDTVSRLQRNGMEVHIDLMYGFPNFDIEGEREIVIDDVKKAIELGVDSLEFSQFYPFYSRLEKTIEKRGLSFPSEQEVVDTILTATDLLERAGFTQASEYAFHRTGDVMLEGTYFGEATDTLALGPSSIGRLNGFAYRNITNPRYNTTEEPPILLMKKTDPQQEKEWSVASFPRMLRIQKDRVTENHLPKFKELLDKGLVVDSGDTFELTRKGKCYISDIHLFLMEEEEQKKLRVFELT
jgi:oxygen-independent coproporphyrinogen-3 oxidase